jgi:hypothetical protein
MLRQAPPPRRRTDVGKSNLGAHVLRQIPGEDRMHTLFDRLPERLFSPLAGANRRIYGALLLDLYPLFFDQVHADVFPSRETVRHEIEERLAVQAVVWQQEADTDDAPTDRAEPPAELTPAAAAYRRLLDAGWLEEELDGYRTRVTVPPAVGVLWAALVEIARPDRVFYGGMVLSIYNNLQRAFEEPAEQVLALRQAAREAQRFLTHLNTMIYGLKGLLGQIAASRDHRTVLSSFFDAFVERILVQDYKRLKTRNNPFRFRQQILHRARELEYDPARRAALVDGFLAQTGASDRAEAQTAIDADIRRLRQVFEQLDGHLARVDRYRERLERRVADTVRYLDHGRPGQAARMAELLQALGPALADLDDGDDAPVPLPVLALLPLAPHGLKEPARQRTPPPPRPLRSRPMDPAARARQQALRAYLDRRRIDPARIARYLDAQLGVRMSVHGAQLRISGVEDFIAFTHCRHLAYLPGGETLRRAYRIEHPPGDIDNAWVRCPAFIVHRRGPPHAP